MKHPVKSHEVLKFILTGATSTLIDLVLYFSLSRFISITLAKLISMISSCTYAFYINKSWTFQVRENVAISHIVKYILAQCINISINVGTNSGLYYLSKNKLLAYIVATGMGMACNFLLQKFFVFNK